jgi:hypothetical protein
LSNTKTLCEKVDQTAGQRVIDSGIFKPGDMIGYFNIDPHGDYGGAKQYAHSGMFAGKRGGDMEGKITCHTICRFGRSWVEDRWWLKTPGHYVYTLVHIADDDPAPSPGSLGGLEGWWKLEYSGFTEYYLVHSNGTVRYTKTAPHPGQRWMGHAEESAYWFMASNGTITFIWRDTGTVEVWKPEGSGYKSVVNGITPGKLTKLP